MRKKLKLAQFANKISKNDNTITLLSSTVIHLGQSKELPKCDT